MNSTSIICSFMLAGFLFLVGHQLIAGPVVFHHSNLLPIKSEAASLDLLKQSTQQQSLISVPN